MQWRLGAQYADDWQNPWTNTTGGPVPFRSSANTASRALLEVTGLLRRSCHRFRGLHLAQQHILDLLLHETIPFGVPGCVYVFSYLRRRGLLPEYVQIIARLFLRSDDVRILLERLERITDAVFQVPILGHVVTTVGVLAAHEVQKPPRGVLVLRLRAHPVETRPPHRTLVDILQAGKAGHLNVACPLAQGRIVRTRENVAHSGRERALTAQIDVT